MKDFLMISRKNKKYKQKKEIILYNKKRNKMQINLEYFRVVVMV